MSVSHRPSEETLAAFAAGRLDEGLALVVAAHVEINPRTRQDLAELDALSGAFLDTIEPEPMAADARTLSMALPHRVEDVPARPVAPPDAAGLAVLAPYTLGRWQSVGRGVALRRVEVPNSEARVFMLRAQPGTRLPAHRHTGAEWTTIVAGAYEHEYGRYAAGDFDEADDRHAHTPVVDRAEGCTCIVALTGNVRFEGMIGRLLQPFVRL
jgi:putative transcriptional regulator